MSAQLVQSAINFSEGRRPEVIAALVDALSSASGAKLADYSADWDHNRMVGTLLGDADSVAAAAMRAARVAIRHIDLNAHSGEHPRIGAVDVVPLVPIRDCSMERCIAVSVEVARTIGEELRVPTYLYEKSADPRRIGSLPMLRKGQFEGLLGSRLEGDRAPDFGPDRVHPTAGATVVGARMPLVAYNIDLDSDDLDVAKAIARRIRLCRSSQGYLSGVRALGLSLVSPGKVQVSMNLTAPELSPMPAVFDFVREEAALYKVNILRSEVIGLIPKVALGGESPERILWRDFRPSQILENWL